MEALTVSSPLAATEWTVGVYTTVRWGASNVMLYTDDGTTLAYVRVELLKGGELVQTISSSRRASLKRASLVPVPTLVGGADFTVKVTDLVDGISATSEVFTVLGVPSAPAAVQLKASTTPTSSGIELSWSAATSYSVAVTRCQPIWPSNVTLQHLKNHK